MNFLFDILSANRKNLRNEIKFHIRDLSRPEIEAILSHNPLFFSEIYQRRTINNLYYDDQNLQCYIDNQDGNENRFKIRIRWYGNTFGLIKNPFLEFKIKKASSGLKLRYRLQDFELKDLSDLKNIQGVLESSGINEYLSSFIKKFNIVLLNSYERKYYLSLDEKIRATVDFNLRYYRLNSLFNNYINYINNHIDTILELKYRVGYQNKITDITNHFPFRLSKFSKYVEGIKYLKS